MLIVPASRLATLFYCLTLVILYLIEHIAFQRIAGLLATTSAVSSLPVFILIFSRPETTQTSPTNLVHTSVIPRPFDKTDFSTSTTTFFSEYFVSLFCLERVPYFASS